MTRLFLIIFCVVPLVLIGQLSNPDADFKPIRISEMMDLIINSPEDEVYLSNLRIFKDKEPFSRFPHNPNRSVDHMDSLINTFETIIIDKKVSMINCGFQDPILFARIHFKKLFYYEYIVGSGNQKWIECTFDRRFNAHAIGSFAFIFERCHFNQYHTESFNASTVQFDFCTIGTCSIINDNKMGFSFNGNKFFGDAHFRFSGESDVYFSNCDFTPKDGARFITFYDGSIINSLTFSRDTFNLPVIFQQVSIRESFLEEGSQFNEFLDIHKVNFPENNTQLRWPTISDSKLKVFAMDTIFGSNDRIDNTTDSKYFALLKSYAQLQRIYKNNGDRVSFNASYVEMRDMETKKYKYDFKQRPSLKSFFEWRLNRFLKRFCNYGTSPVKALIYSILVMAIFSMLYFFFPSEQERIRVRALLKGRQQKEIDQATFFKLLKELGTQVIDAFATSMNAFVTLGYGQMPVKGIGKYLAVLEGLIGWFLLSIFSVSLISQILQ